VVVVCVRFGEVWCGVGVQLPPRSRISLVVGGGHHGLRQRAGVGHLRV